MAFRMSFCFSISFGGGPRGVDPDATWMGQDTIWE